MLKRGRARFFGKFLVCPKLAQNRLKMDIFGFFLNLDHYFFLIFSMKLVDYKAVKVPLLDFSDRFPFAQKRANNEQKMTFWTISQNRIIVFCWKWPKSERGMMWHHYTSFISLEKCWFSSYRVKSSRPIISLDFSNLNIFWTAPPFLIIFCILI